MENNTSKSFFKEPQNIIALAVSLISICALVVSVKQTQIMSEQRALMHQQAKASVWPRLSMGVSKSHKLEDYSISEFKLIIANGGVGPAIVTDVRVSFDGKVVLNWGYLFQEFGLPKDTPLFSGNRGFNNGIIKIGESYPVLSLTQNLPVAQGFYDNREKIKVEIWYKSIFGDKWKLTYFDDYEETIEVDPTASIPAEEQFEKK